MPVKTIQWADNAVKIVDQTKLPGKLKYLFCRDLKTLFDAIRELKVRGAPALGVASAFGVYLGVKDFTEKDRRKFEKKFLKVCDYIGSSRPTAVNLFKGIEAMKRVVKENPAATVPELKKLLKLQADLLYEEDRVVCRRMAGFGAHLIKPKDRLLTVCNTGALATVDYGTAVGCMFRAKEQGKAFKVFSCETRPLLQGARLTTWELKHAGIDVTLICDNMAATLMGQGKIDAVFAGADRIAANGDTANKIGTYSLAVLAKYHRIPFYVVAPLSTFDPKIRSGKNIPIEERNPDEVTHCGGKRMAALGIKVYNPAFDVTDHRLITAIVTENGIIRSPDARKVKKGLNGRRT